MGYRSDVAYTIRFTSEEAYRLFILEAKAKELGGCFSNDDSFWDEAECDDKKWQINFHAQNVKWYPSYPDVQKHEQLLELADDWIDEDSHVSIKDGTLSAQLRPYRLGYVRVRVGEESNDIEERVRGNGEYDWLNVSRQIVGDWL